MNFKLICIILIFPTFKAVAQRPETISSHNPKPLLDYDYKRPLLKIEKQIWKNENGLLRFSAVTGYREAIRPTKGAGNFESEVDLKNRTSRIYMINLSIEEMLTMGYYRSKDVELAVKDPLKYRYDPSQGDYLEWMRKYAHCFEFMIPYGGVDNVLDVMKNELCHYFGVTFKTEKRTVNALILVRTSNVDKIKSAGIGEGNYDMKGKFNNVPISRIGHPLSDANMPPMIDETGYKENVDLDLKLKSWKDIPALRKELRRYDLDLKQEKREVDKPVIREIKINN